MRELLGKIILACSTVAFVVTASGADDDAVSRELSVYNGSVVVTAPAIVDASSREVSVYNGPVSGLAILDAASRECTVYNGSVTVTPRTFVDAASRECSVYNGTVTVTPRAFVDASSRELTVYNGTVAVTPPAFVDASSREWTVYNGTVTVTPRTFVDASSREFTVYNDLDGLLGPQFVDAASREFSVYRTSPDLRVIAVTTPSSAQTDDPMTVSWVLKNFGDGEAKAPWSDRIRLSTDNALNESDPIVGVVPAPANLTIAPGAEQMRSAVVAAPSTPGSYYVAIECDVNNEVVEYVDGQPADTNNATLWPTPFGVAQAPRPDLIVTNITPPPGNIAPGQVVSVAWTVKNVGTAPAVGPWKEAIYASLDDQIGNDIAGPVFTYTNILPVGGEVVRVQNFTVPNVPPGGYWFVVCADNPPGQLIELDEANNCAIVPVCVNCLTANLVPQTLVTSPTAGAATPLAVSWSVSNVGQGDASGTWTDRIFLSSDQSLGNDFEIGSEIITQGVPAGSLYNRSKLVTVGYDIPEGLYYVILSVDASNSLSEPGGESDNLKVSSGPISVTHPPTADLVVTSIDAPTSGQTGSPITVTWTVANNGTADASLPWLDRIYLSSDAAAGGDLLVSVTSATQSIPAGESRTRSATITLPASVGPRWIVVQTDANDAVEEGTHETNNTLVSSSPINVVLPPSPGLWVSSVSPAPAGAVNDPVSVSWSVTNNGDVPTSGTWQERVYASPDDAIGADLTLATFTFNDVIAPEATATRTKSVPVPNLPNGYRVVVCADVSNVIAEVNESDNCGIAASSSTVLLADLVAGNVVAPPSGIADQPITVTFTVTNAGGAPAQGSWVDAVYLSADDQVGSDVLLGTAIHSGPLAVGQPYAAVVTANVPGLLQGTYRVVVVADALNAVTEFGEGDLNAALAPGTIEITQPPRPNLGVAGISDAPPGLVGQPFQVSYAVLNTGPAVASGSWTDRISAVNVATGAVVTLHDEFVSGPVAANGGSYAKTVVVNYPTQPGTWKLRLEVDRTNLLNEGVNGGELDNVKDAQSTFLADGYVVSVSTPIDKAIGGTPIPLSGLATLTGGTPVPNIPVAIAIDVQGTTRTLNATTDPTGAYAITFQPLANEGGEYALRAGPKAAVPSQVQDSFIIHNLAPQPAAGQVIVYPTRESVSATFAVKNVGDVALSGLTVSPATLPGGVTITAVPDSGTVPALQSVPVHVTVAADSSAAFGTYEVPLTIAVTQGVQKTYALTVKVQPLAAQLAIARTSLSAAMAVPVSAAEATQTIVEFQVTNIGAGVATDAQVLIPDAPWLSLGVPALLGSIGPGESRGVVLILAPGVNQALGPYTGTIVISATNTSATVPFTFTAVSTKKGDLTVTVTDEFTYWSAPGCPGLPECPHVADALVEVRDAYTNAIVASGTTGDSGVLTFAELPEAYYKISASASGHGTFGTTILVNGSDQTNVEAFLPAEVVSYQWTVVPTFIQEQYNITLQALFQTNVPAPVVTIEPAFVDLKSMTGPTMQVDFAIRNYGLIAAQDAHFNVGTHPRYKITPLVSELGDLPGTAQGQQPVPLIVPCMIEDLEYGGGVASGECIGVKFELAHTVICNIPREYVQAVVFGLPDSNCPPWNPPPQRGEPPSRGGPASEPTLPIVGSPPLLVQGLPCGACDPATFEPGDPACIELSLDFLKEHVVKFLQKLTLNKLPIDADSLDITLELCKEKCCNAGTEAAKATLEFTGSVTFKPPSPNLSIEIPMAFAFVYGGLPSNFEGKIKGVIGLSFSIPVSVTVTGETACGGSIFSSTVEIKLSGDADALVGGMVEVEGKITVPTLAESLPVSGEAQAGGNVGVHVAVLWKSGSGWSGEACFKGLYLGIEGTVNIPAIGDLVAAVIPLPCKKYYIFCPHGYPNKCACESPFNGGGCDVSSLFGECDFCTRDSQGGGAPDPELQAELDALSNELGAVLPTLWPLVLPTGTTTPPPPKAGICATVKIQIDQQLKLARQGFLATLELQNNGADLPLEGIDIDILVKDANGVVIPGLFAGADSPTVVGMSDVSGSGALVAGASGIATWTLVPSDLAAPDGPTAYFVSGTLRYVHEGVETIIPLFPVPITVLPNPSLALDYFLEARVYSDDPFTPLLEPAIPFSLGLLAANEGAGIAYSASITSSQPKIVENEQGLVVDFNIIGSELDAKPIAPSLTVDFGDLEPNERRVAQWFITSSLQGKFIDFNATWQNVSGLGSPELSILDSVETWPMQHVVRALYPDDDGKPDFLVTCPPGVPSGLCPFDPILPPQSLHTSNGTVESVFAILTGTTTTKHPEAFSATLQAPVGSGWNYIRLDDPFLAALKLVSVQRSDGSDVLVGPNAWQTSRTVHPLGGGPYPEHLVHIFDHSSLGPGDGVYTLIFVPDVTQPVVQHWYTVASHGAAGVAGLEIVNALGANWSDSRLGGIERVDVLFDEPVKESTFTGNAILIEGRKVPDNTSYAYSGSISALLSPDGTLGSILFDPPLAAPVRYCLTLAGVTDLSGNPIAGPGKVRFTALPGDATSDLRVTVADLAGIGSLIGTDPIDVANPLQVRSDVDRDGKIDLADVVAALAQNGTDARLIANPCDTPASQEPGPTSGIAHLNPSVAGGPPVSTDDGEGGVAGGVASGSESGVAGEGFGFGFEAPDVSHALIVQTGNDDPTPSVLDTGDGVLYRIDADAGSTVCCVLRASVEDAWSSLAVGFGRVPTLARYDALAAVPGAATQSILIASIPQAPVFLVARSQVPGSTREIPLTLQVERVAAGVGGAAPDRVGAGVVTVRLEGGELNRSLAVSLAAADGRVWRATRIAIVDAAHASATFDLSDARIGDALDLHWDLDRRTGVLPGALVVDAPDVRRSVLGLDPIVPASRGRTVALRVRNPGNVDLPEQTVSVAGEVRSAGTIPPGEKLLVEVPLADGPERVLIPFDCDDGRESEPSLSASSEDALRRLGDLSPTILDPSVQFGDRADQALRLAADRASISAGMPTTCAIEATGSNADDVTFVVVLDKRVDAATVRLLDMAFGDDRIRVPAERCDFAVERPASDDSSLVIRFEAKFLPASSTIIGRWLVLDRRSGVRPAFGSEAEAELLAKRPLDRVRIGWSLALKPASAAASSDDPCRVHAAVRVKSGDVAQFGQTLLALVPDAVAPAPIVLDVTQPVVTDDHATLVVSGADSADVVGVNVYLAEDDGNESLVSIAPARVGDPVVLAIDGGHRYRVRGDAIDAQGNRTVGTETRTLVSLGAMPCAPVRVGEPLPAFVGAAAALAVCEIELVDRLGVVIANATVQADERGRVRWVPPADLRLTEGRYNVRLSAAGQARADAFVVH